MEILALSDTVVDWIYSQTIRTALSNIDLIIGCGDLPNDYLEYIVSTLDKPLLYVNGNHSSSEVNQGTASMASHGAINLHRKVIRHNGISFAGIEGCVRYKQGDHQYSQFEMWVNIIHLLPSLLVNRLTTGQYLNVLVTHASPWGIHDQPDFAHQGVKAYRWFIQHFQPDYHLHGHVHVYRPDMVIETQCGKTKVINTFRYRKIHLT